MPSVCAFEFTSLCRNCSTSLCFGARNCNLRWRICETFSLIFEFSTIAPACLVNWDPESSSLLKWMKFLNRQVLVEAQVYALYCIKLSLQRNNSLFKIRKCYACAYSSNLGICFVLSFINTDFPLNISNLLAQLLRDIRGVQLQADLLW